MSADEIQFEDVRYREPRKMRRPDRDPKIAVMAYQVPGPRDMPIFIDRAAADAIERHALRDTSVELGGIMLGYECIDDQTGEPFVWVTKSLEAKHYENTQASFTYTHDSWEEITRERDRVYPDLDVVGWYHTHPDFGIFLSSHDLFIHRNFFSQPLQVAYVVDPIRQTRGFFQWRSDALDQTGGYWITSDRKERQALSRFVNDLENIPDAQGGGGGFSPRLEAELIAMLTRPQYRGYPSNDDRVQSSAFNGLVGMLLGVLAFSVFLWVNNLSQQSREQLEVIRGLEKSVKEIGADGRVAYDLLRGRLGGEAKSIDASYREALAERDRFRAEVSILREYTTRLAAENSGLQIAKNDAAMKTEQLKEYESIAKDAAKLRGELDEAKAKAALLDVSKELEAGSYQKKYDAAFYLATVGWGLALLLGVSLGYVWVNGPPSLLNPSESDVAPPPSGGGGDSRFRIG